MFNCKTICLAIVAISAVTLVSGAMAEETYLHKDHPRRHEVNSRLEHQNKRINNEVKEGEMSKAKGAKLHKEDRQIRQEEHDMASQNGGHLTKEEQKTLNQQENAVSKQIGK